MTLTDLPTPLTIFPALVVEAVVAARNRMYDRGLLRRFQLAAPVISVGNLTVGGTGKTPLAIHIAELLLEAGHRPALLSRGYGRRGGPAPFLVAPGQEVPRAALTLGDEPALIRRRVRRLWLGIDPVRFRAGSAILLREPKAVFVLDDGFQHRSLRRNLDLVVVDRSQWLAANHILPRGILREPLGALRRADAVLLNGKPQPGVTDEAGNGVRRAAPGLRIFQLATSIEALVPFPLWLRGAPYPAGPARPHRAFLVAGIGNPERFRADVLGFGIEIAGERFFRDHARLGESGWAECSRLAEVSGADCMLATEKDAVKIEKPPRFPLTICVQAARVEENAEFARLICQAAEERR